MAIMMAILYGAFIMKTSTIAEAKNNLSHLIHQLEAGESIRLTRYGKPVAVMISEDQYQNLIAPNKNLNAAILNWRSQLDDDTDVGLNDKELKAIRKDNAEREFSWDE
jgi:prevent-host-death family protein